MSGDLASYDEIAARTLSSLHYFTAPPVIISGLAIRGSSIGLICIVLGRPILINGKGHVGTLESLTRQAEESRVIGCDRSALLWSIEHRVRHVEVARS